MNNLITRGQTTLSDSVIFGGVNYSWEMQSKGDLTIGNAPSAEIKFTTSFSGLQIGDSVTYQAKFSNENTYTQIGVFNIYSVEKNTHGKYDVVAYDNVSKFNQNVDSVISSIPADGMYMKDLLSALCTEIGVTLYSQNFTNNFFIVKPFSVKGVTGRQLLQWIGEAAGSNVISDNQGRILVKKYETAIFEDTYNNGKYSKINIANFDCQPIDKVVSVYEDGDVGITAGTGDNILKIVGNPLLYVDDTARIQTAVTNIYNTVSRVVQYTPFLYTPADLNLVMCGLSLQLGDNILINSPETGDKEFLVMNKSFNNSGMTINCYGNATRNTVVEKRSTEYTGLNGKYNSLKTTVDATVSEVGTLSGNVSTLTQTVTGLSSRVTDAEGNISTLQQTAQGLQTQVNGKVGNTEVISKINQSAEAITISASKVNLNGYLTITAGDSRYDASGAAATAQSTAISTAAGDATTKANNAKSGAISTVNNGLSAGTTTVNGGCITTGVIQSSDSNHQYSVNLNTGTVTMKNANITGGSINMQGSATWSAIHLQSGSNTNYYSEQSPIGLRVRNSDNGHQTNYYGGGIVTTDYSTDKTRMYISPEGGASFSDSNGNVMAQYHADARNNITCFCNTISTSWSYVSFDPVYLPRFSGFQIVLTVQDANGRTLTSTFIPATHCWREVSDWEDPTAGYHECWARFDSGHQGFAAFEKKGNEYRIYAKVAGGDNDSRCYVYGVR